MNGRMIVVDGGNGAGKTTVLAAIQKHLTELGHAPVMTREPGGTHLGEQLREILLHMPMCDMTELMLFAAARAQHVHEVILPAIAQGKVVVSDRFDSSSVSFQHYGRGLPLDAINTLNRLALNGFKADMTIVLDIDTKTGMERVLSRGQGADRFESARVSFQEKARQGYLEQAKNDPTHFTVIDASQSLEQVIAEALAVVDRVIA